MALERLFEAGGENKGLGRHEVPFFLGIVK